MRSDVRKSEDRKQYFHMGPGTIDSGIKIQVRHNVNLGQNKSLIRLSIGTDSVVAGNFIFENGYGAVKIGDRTFVGGGDFICIDSIEIGSDVLISWGCTLMDNNAHALNFEERKNDVSEWKRGLEEGVAGYYKNWANVSHKPIVIKDKAWIGFKCIILKGVTIGEGAVVGAGSVVTKDIPDWTVVAGNPAEIVKRLK